MSAKDIFLNTYGGDIAAAGAATGLDPRLIASQAGLESAWGGSSLSKDYNNFFGIKATDGTGVRLPTKEYVGGRMVNTTALFETYDSPQAGFSAWGDLLKSNPRYADVLSANTLDGQISALAKSGYATDINYGSKLASIAKGAGMEALGMGLDMLAPGVGTAMGALGGIDLSDGFGMNDIGGAALGAIPGGALVGEVIGGAGDGIKSVVDFFKNLFSVQTAQRTSLVLLGLALVMIAAIAFVMQTKAAQAVTKAVTKGAA